MNQDRRVQAGAIAAFLEAQEKEPTESPWPVDALVQLLRETDPARMGKVE